ncbi:MAG: hypothetical protein ACOY3X_00975 [Pseudomonadota bacterium]
MDYLNWIRSEAGAIASAPFVYATSMVLVALAVAWACRIVFGAEAAAKGAQIDLLKEKINQLEGEKSTLLEKLEGHGDDIMKIKADLESRPRIIVSDTAPENARNGDIWLKP